MFEISGLELALVAAVVLILFGPKELPQLLRHVGQVLGKARAMSRHLRAGLDEMMHQAELEEMEKEWRRHNARIMAGEESPAPAVDPAWDAQAEAWAAACETTPEDARRPAPSPAALPASHPVSHPVAHPLADAVHRTGASGPGSPGPPLAGPGPEEPVSAPDRAAAAGGLPPAAVDPFSGRPLASPGRPLAGDGAGEAGPSPAVPPDSRAA